MQREELACLGFSRFMGIGPMTFKQLLKEFGTADQAYHAPEKKLARVLANHLLVKFLQYRQEIGLTKEAKKLEELKIGYVSQLSNHYPFLLKQISDPPIGLFYKGNLQSYAWSTEKSLVIVGSRKPTLYGQNTAQRFAKQLAQLGYTIISGLALGIDAAAHQGALAAKGKTIAVLGCGVDVVYPKQHQALYQAIIANNGLILSEFPPGSIVVKGMFVARNRIITGLSRGVLIVEGGQRSGTLITARYAAEQGREIFALPGPIGGSMSAAPHLLIKQGATLVTEINDIIEVLA